LKPWAESSSPFGARPSGLATIVLSLRDENHPPSQKRRIILALMSSMLTLISK
jgi:hypothetical protein